MLGFVSSRAPRRRNAASAAVAIAVFASAFAISAWAQGGAGERPTLHEDLPAPSDTPVADVDQPIFGPPPQSGQNPAAFADKGKILPKPDADAKTGAKEPVFGTGSFAADRDTEAVPDMQTGPDSTLEYVTVFNPTVIPFKRMSSMDAVRDDYTLYSSSPSTREQLTVGGTQSPRRDLFWGSLAIRIETGRDIPIPSVAPDMRILSYETTPSQLDLTFSRDTADNYYVRTDESGISGDYRLVFLVDAPADHFGVPVPRGYRVYDLPNQPDFPDLPPLPQRARTMAERGLRNLGIHRSMAVEDALDKLVYYFRGFEAKDPPTPTGDIYWDLFVSQAGVCRHRSFAFMITANALGIPTRYLTNEAHAWVEVWLPGVSWMRVDLGGAALRMNVHGANDKTVYRPRNRDDLSQPPEYANNYTQLQGDINGLTQDQIDEGRAPIDPDAPDLGPDGDDDDDDDDDPGSTGPRIGPGKSLPSLPPSVLKDKTRTAVTVTEADQVGYRGESIRVRGALTEAESGEGVEGQRIDIYLAPAGQDGDGAVLVGFTATADDGSYQAEVDLPRDLELQSYELFAASPGDSQYSPAVSE
jgi:transglutaminase-like putative cysteine protease